MTEEEGCMENENKAPKIKLKLVYNLTITPPGEGHVVRVTTEQTPETMDKIYRKLIKGEQASFKNNSGGTVDIPAWFCRGKAVQYTASTETHDEWYGQSR